MTGADMAVTDAKSFGHVYVTGVQLQSDRVESGQRRWCHWATYCVGFGGLILSIMTVIAARLISSYVAIRASVRVLRLLYLQVCVLCEAHLSALRRGARSLWYEAPAPGNLEESRKTFVQELLTRVMAVIRSLYELMFSSNSSITAE